MIKVIAFSGPGNTGKTTAINVLGDELKSLGYRSIVSDEIARRNITADSSLEEIQRSVFEGELQRQEELSEIKAISDVDFALVDRPWRDGMVYLEWNKNLGKISDEEYRYLMSGYQELEKSYGCQYDCIISRSEPIKPSANPKFQHYNSNSLNKLITIETKMKADCPVIYGKNGRDSWFNQVTNRIETKNKL